MITILDWCIIFLVYAFGISVFIIGLILHKEAFENIFFTQDYVIGFLFNLGAFVLELLGVVVFYGGYRLMEMVK